MRRTTPALVLTGLLTLLFTLIVPSAAHADTATFTKAQDWGSGYSGQYTVKNTGTTTLNGWTVSFDLPSGTSLGTYWDSLMTSSGSRYTFKNREYNGTLAPGASTTFGFIASGSGSPVNCTLNGAPCGGGQNPGDTTPPSVPSSPRSTGTTSTSISLAWNASTDNSGTVKDYRVYEGSAVVATVTGTTATISGLAASTTHTYTVTARDAANNESARSASVTATTQTGGGGGTPVAANGQLHVCGTKLCNKNGKQIQLRGMSTHGLQWYRQCVTTGSLTALATDWRADVVRLSMYVQEDGYETNPRAFTDLVHTLIEQVSAQGMYVIVDWHMLTPGDPNYNLTRARTFFTEIAQRHAARPNILYEVANEPNGVSWGAIKSYAEQIIPVIRAQDPDGIVLVGTRAWSSLGVSEGASETEVTGNPVNATNIMYTFHFYAASHGTEYLNTLSRAADRIPMFVTEFGTQNYAGEDVNDFTMSQRYLDLMANKKISWVNWNFSDDHRSGAVFKTGTCNAGGPWTGTAPLKEAGVWIRDQIRTADDF